MAVPGASFLLVLLLLLLIVGRVEAFSSSSFPRSPFLAAGSLGVSGRRSIILATPPLHPPPVSAAVGFQFSRCCSSATATPLHSFRLPTALFYDPYAPPPSGGDKSAEKAAESRSSSGLKDRQPESTTERNYILYLLSDPEYTRTEMITAMLATFKGIVPPTEVTKIVDTAVGEVGRALIGLFPESEAVLYAKRLLYSDPSIYTLKEREK